MVLQPMNRRLSVWLLLNYLLVLIHQANNIRLVHGQNYTSFNFLTFNSTDQLLILGDAIHNSTTSSVWLNLLHGTSSGKNYTCGALIYANSIQMRDSSSGIPAVASFSTSFTFSMAGANSAGFAFMFAVNNRTTGGPGAAMCLLMKTQNGNASNHLFAVEFDTWLNPEFSDPSNNHVGVNINSMKSAALHNFCGEEKSSCSYFVTDQDFTSWIDYDSATQSLEVFLAKGSTVQGVSKPASAVIQVPHLDIADVVNDYMFVGFSGSGAMFQEIHKIKSWSFKTGSFMTRKDVIPGVAKQGKSSVALIAGIVSAVCGSIICVIFCIGYFVIWPRRVKSGGASEVLPNESPSSALFASEGVEENLMWPRPFSFQELSVATNDFSEERLLGEGGFGQVFKGTLGSQSLVAVKRTRIRDESNKGAKEFLAELSVISQIRHRNLIRLYGWCQENKSLLLVFEYMPNSSLEKWLFDKRAKNLTWLQRQHIVTGVAAALAYLHEGWTQCILHRDIKAANVLLDQDFNPHVGDFGLARLTNHNNMGRTTALAGTFGYLAPETAQEGKVTQKSDVYSFGILALEVASGRPVLRMNYLLDEDDDQAEPVNLLECVWHAHERQDLMSVADPRLQSQLDPDEVKCMFQLGLLCCHPDPDARPVMRVVHQHMVDGKVGQLVASLPPSKPTVQYYIGPMDIQHTGSGSTNSNDARRHSQGYSASQDSSATTSGLTWSSSGSALSKA